MFEGSFVEIVLRPSMVNVAQKINELETAVKVEVSVEEPNQETSSNPATHSTCKQHGPIWMKSSRILTRHVFRGFSRHNTEASIYPGLSVAQHSYAAMINV